MPNPRRRSIRHRAPSLRPTSFVFSAPASPIKHFSCQGQSMNRRLPPHMAVDAFSGKVQSGFSAQAVKCQVLMMAELDIGGRDLILVTGASGFLGAAIANTARLAGY